MMAGNPEQSQHDQLWRAFQYLGGEMSAAKAEAFEQRMLEDQDLCSTVAETSLLMSAIAGSAESTVAPQRSQHDVLSRPVASRVAAILSTLCCCAGLLVCLSQTSTFESADFGDRIETGEANMLVAAWADTAIHTDQPEEHKLDVVNKMELVVPEWMLAGVSGVDIDEIEEPQVPEMNDQSAGLL